jgi:hypothetical protein
MGLKPRRLTTALCCTLEEVENDNQALDKLFLNTAGLAGRYKPKVCGASIRPKNSLRVEAVAKPHYWEEAET